MALYTRNVLETRTIADLKKFAADHDVEIEKGWKKNDLIEALLLVPDEDDELEPELEDEIDDEELDAELDEELPDEVVEFQEKVKAELDADYEEDIELPEEDELDEPAPAKATKARKPKAEKSGDTLAAKQVAAILSTNLKTTVDAKTLRQFFRSPASTIEAVGSGGRYEFAVEDIETIQKEFEAWKSGHASRGSKRGAGKKSTNQVIEEVEEVEEIEELELEDDLDDEIDEADLELEEED